MHGRIWAMAVLVVGCTSTPAGDSGTSPCADSPPTWNNFGHGFFLDYCASCHSASSPQRYGAPDGVNFDTQAEVAANAPLIRQQVLTLGTMPLGGGVDASTLAELDSYLTCGP